VFQIRIHFIRIRPFRLNTDPDPDTIRIQGFDEEKIGKNLQLKKIKYIFDQNLQFAYP
jgi:hypothetical protein